jgi:hypothetical protein
VLEVIGMYSEDDYIEPPDWVINDPWLIWLDRWVWWQVEKLEES